MPYHVYYVDTGLDVAPLKTICHIGRLLAREDGLHEGGEFIPGGGTADQALPGLIIRVEDDGRIGGRDWIHARQPRMSRHGKARAWSTLNGWLAKGSAQE